MISPDDEVARRMENIMQVFRHAQSITAATSDFSDLQSNLDKTENEYRSVAYEAASMQIALDDFEKFHHLKRWQEFKSGIGKNHASQVHAGLGWALAKQNIPSGKITPVDATMYERIVDGYGYYEGIFRHRSSVKNQAVPAELKNSLDGYDQGLGRAVYYYCKGETRKVSEMIFAFPATRHAHLWRGAAIALVYVGGFSDSALNSFYRLASENQSQLGVAAALVAKSRTDAESMTSYSEAACNMWCNCSAKDAAAVVQKVTESIPPAGDAYKNMIQMLVNELSLINSCKS